MLSALLTCLLAHGADAPRAVVWLTPSGAAVPAAAGLPASLAEGRKLAEQQRYEEAVVEYQRYLALKDRPAKERAQALYELGFIHLVLGDDATAEERVQDALALDPRLAPPAGAAQKQAELLARVKKQLQGRARLEVLERQGDDAPNVVRAALADPDRKVKRVLLRHSLMQTGPFSGSPMRCEADVCVGAIPPPGDSSFTAFYFVEALDAAGSTVGTASSADSPAQLAVVAQRAWYKSPWVWGLAGAALIAAGVVVYAASPPPP